MDRDQHVFFFCEDSNYFALKPHKFSHKITPNKNMRLIFAITITLALLWLVNFY